MGEYTFYYNQIRTPTFPAFDFLEIFPYFCASK